MWPSDDAACTLQIGVRVAQPQTKSAEQTGVMKMAIEMLIRVFANPIVAYSLLQKRSSLTWSHCNI